MMFRQLLVFAAVMSLAGCATTAAPKPAANAEADTLAIVENYFAALNRRDTLALVAYVSPDIEWFSIVDGERIQEVAGRETLVETLRQYFERTVQTHWRIESSSGIGAKLAVTERSDWVEGGVAQSRTTLGVFEFGDGRIRRITYFLDR
jgi:limonene-1,2-epoxide hydrolase